MISAQSSFRTTPRAVTWASAVAVMFAGGSSLSARADPADLAMASIHAEAIRADMRFSACTNVYRRGVKVPNCRHHEKA